MKIAFEACPSVIKVPGDPEFIGALEAAAIGWPFHDAPKDATPDIVVDREGAIYRASFGNGDEAIEGSAVAVAGGLTVDLVEAMIAADPARLWLHCGSVVMGGRLVIFPSHSHAGKSTLVARLAASGYTVFGDDILPLTTDERSGVALGIAPRLRLPLPPNSSEAFRAFVRAAGRVDDGRYQYLDLPQSGLATRGATAPLGAVVLLDRRGGGNAFFSVAPRAAVLQTLISQNFTAATNAAALLGRLHLLMDRLPRLTLHYSDLDEAVALLEDRFENGNAADMVATGYRPRLAAEGEQDELMVRPAAGELPPPEAELRRCDGIALRSVDGEIFLAGHHEAAIYHLNAIGAGVWNLLDVPVSRSAIAETLALAFPDTEAARIEQDVDALLSGLLEAGFVEPVQSSR